MYQYYRYTDIGTDTDFTVGTSLILRVCVCVCVFACVYVCMCVCDHTWAVTMCLRNTMLSIIQ